MKKKLASQSVDFIRYLNLNRKLLYKEFHKNEELLAIIREAKINTVFQPIISLETGKTIGYEILNRPYPSEAFPTPDTFYDYVGESNHIFTVESFIRNIALKRYHEQLKGLGNHEDHYIFLNIHPLVLTDPNYKKGITKSILGKYNLSPERVVLELTEKKAGINYSLFTKLVDHYKMQGFHIAVDDAGAGYNSLQTLLFLDSEY